jgi:hypothetical protein
VGSIFPLEKFTIAGETGPVTATEGVVVNTMVTAAKDGIDGEAG